MEKINICHWYLNIKHKWRCKRVTSLQWPCSRATAVLQCDPAPPAVGDTWSMNYTTLYIEQFHNPYKNKSQWPWTLYECFDYLITFPSYFLKLYKVKIQNSLNEWILRNYYYLMNMIHMRFTHVWLSTEGAHLIMSSV